MKRKQIEVKNEYNNDYASSDSLTPKDFGAMTKRCWCYDLTAPGDNGT